MAEGLQTVENCKASKFHGGVALLRNESGSGLVSDGASVFVRNGLVEGAAESLR